MIVAAFIDVILLPLPFQFQDREWLLGFVTQMVDRGIIPLLGVTLFITGNWVDSLAGKPVESRNSWRSLQFWILILASLLSLLYLLLTVVHVNNALSLRSERISSITEQAAQAEQQLDQRVEAEIGQRRQTVGQLLQNPQLREQAISQGAISQEDAQALQEFEEDPEKLDAYLQGLEEQAEQLRTEQQTEIGVRREEAQQQARMDAFKSIWRIGLSSILLAIGYGIIGWTGLRLHSRSAS